MKWQPESWHIQHSQCFFRCHKFSDPFVLFSWLIYSSFFFSHYGKGNYPLEWRPSTLLHTSSRTEKKEHWFIFLTKSATWTESHIILRPEVQGCSVFWQNLHKEQIICFISSIHSLTYSSGHQWVPWQKMKVAHGRPSSSCSALNSFLISKGYYVPFLEAWLPSLAWLPLFLQQWKCKYLLLILFLQQWKKPHF